MLKNIGRMELFRFCTIRESFSPLKSPSWAPDLSVPNLTSFLEYCGASGYSPNKSRYNFAEDFLQIRGLHSATIAEVTHQFHLLLISATCLQHAIVGSHPNSFLPLTWVVARYQVHLLSLWFVVISRKLYLQTKALSYCLKNVSVGLHRYNEQPGPGARNTYSTICSCWIGDCWFYWSKLRSLYIWKSVRPPN
jgi:hypothetical protein